MEDRIKCAGIIEIFDSEGNLLSKSHNMILKEGRKAIMTSGYTGIVNGNTRMAIGTSKEGYEFADEDDDYDCINKKTDIEINIAGDESSPNGVVDVNLVENLSVSIVGTYEVGGDAPFYISTIGLGNPITPTLYTRSVFAPILLEKDCSYTIKYTIYF